MEVAKPPPMPVNADNVPSALKVFDRWLCWSWSWNGKKYDKPPLNARTGYAGASTKPADWSSFDVAFKAHQSGRFDGIGFALGKAGTSGANFCGFDIDDCVTDGVIRADAIYLAGVLDSYTEISPSGTGLKVFMTGHLLNEGGKADAKRGIEFYDSGRYFCVTGNHIAGFPKEVNERSKAMTTLRNSLFAAVPRSFSNLNERDRVLSALDGLDKSRAVGYQSWLSVGMALYAFDPSLLDAWDAWSASCVDKYTPGACAKKWQTFGGGSIKVNSLFFWAKEDGWVEPEFRQQPKKESKKESPPESADNSGKNGKHDSSSNGKPAKEDEDPNMGDGLTDEDGAGPWKLKIEMSDPRKYWLRSPIWQDRVDLRDTDGYVLLTKRQLMKWEIVRIEAMDQSGDYVGPDKSKAPVWDGRKGPRLLQRLLHFAEKVEAAPDFDRVLGAAEYIIDAGRKSGVLQDDRRTQLIGVKNVFCLDDGSIAFRLRPLAAQSKKDGIGVTFEDLRDAANKFGEQYWPEGKDGKRSRYYRFSKKSIEAIENRIDRKGRRHSKTT